MNSEEKTMRPPATYCRLSLLMLTLVLFLPAQAVAQAGQLDPAFGKGGIVTTSFGVLANGGTSVAATVIQPDGKIVVFGELGQTGSTSLVVARYNADGTADSTFGSSGIAALGGLTFPSAMALQPDGKIVVLGFNTGGFSGSAGTDVVRFSSNGSLDTTFGNGGVATTGIISLPDSSGIVIQPDGKILVASGELFRLLPDGTLDSTFGSGGQSHVLGGDLANTLALLPKGKILVTSESFFPSSGFLSRYSSTGSLDTTFAIGGQLGTTGPAHALLALSNGEFLVGGNLSNSVLHGPIGFAVSRYQAVGASDAKFGSHGGVVTLVPNFPAVLTAGMGLQSTGDIVTLGTASAGTSQVFALARYTSSGVLDPTFGSSGTVTTSFGTSVIAAGGLAIQSDGKIVAAGSYGNVKSSSSSEVGFKVARYLGQ
jgi:uncharacterized delta-60 repeat protein